MFFSESERMKSIKKSHGAFRDTKVQVKSKFIDELSLKLGAIEVDSDSMSITSSASKSAEQTTSKSDEQMAFKKKWPDVSSGGGSDDDCK